VSANAGFYLILYLAALHGFAGVVEVLRSIERKNIGDAGWTWTLASGVTDLLVAAVAIIGGLYNNSSRVVVFIYAAGIIYSACIRIARAFRRTEIVYIQ
jgi:uncharacterized membrane protein HdeD (DUF308 family)